MLPGKLIRVRHARNKLVPLYLEASDSNLLELAEQVLMVYRDAVGRTRGEIEEELADFIPEGPRGLLPAGLAKLLEDRCEFEVAADHPPDELRAAVFKFAAAHRAQAALAGVPFDRNSVLAEEREERAGVCALEGVVDGLVKCRLHEVVLFCARKQFFNFPDREVRDPKTREVP